MKERKQHSMVVQIDFFILIESILKISMLKEKRNGKKNELL